MKVLFIFGTRPEAIKLSPVIEEFRKISSVEVVICVTAQHRGMLDQVLELFDLRPHYDLDIMLPDQSLFDITSAGLLGIRDVLEKEQPHMLLVQGDTTTAFVGSLAAYYLKVPVGHVEAGLRTGDKHHPFPEEVNRILCDALSDILFAPTERARDNLLREGIQESRIHVTGNTVVDALLRTTHRLRGVDSPPGLSQPLTDHLRQWREGNGRVILVTGHRRESFGPGLENICSALKEIAQRNPDVNIIYPVHLNPHVRDPAYRILGQVERVHLIDPLGYAPFVWLMGRAYLVLTDSGGIQEEAPSLAKPVLVMREMTERPEVVEVGAAKVVGTDKSAIVEATQRLLDDPAEYQRMAQAKNPFGDGHAAERIVRIVLQELGL